MELRVPNISSALSYRLFIPHRLLPEIVFPFSFSTLCCLLLFNLLPLLWYLLYISLPPSLASPLRGLSSFSPPPPFVFLSVGSTLVLGKKSTVSDY